MSAGSETETDPVIETRFGQVEIERVAGEVAVTIDDSMSYEVTPDEADAIADRLKAVAEQARG